MSYDIQFGEFSTWFNAKEATIKLAEDPATALLQLLLQELILLRLGQALTGSYRLPQWRKAV